MTERCHGRRMLSAGAVIALLAVGCSSGTHPRGLPRSGSPTQTSAVAPLPPTAFPAPTARPTPLAGPYCPPLYRAPDPARPVVSLRFVVADDYASLTGHENVAFTPDLTISQLVFRVWANGPRPSASGAESRVTRVRVEGVGVTPTFESGGAPPGHPGTLVRIPLSTPLLAGHTIHVDLDFTFTLPTFANERFGHRSGLAWFASGFPLLAYERGRGFDEEPATSAFAETATSEDFRLADLSVDVPVGAAVLATGSVGQVTPSTPGHQVHHFSADAVRDVGVAAGAFTVVSGHVGGVEVEVGMSPLVGEDPYAYLNAEMTAVADHVARFGPFPYSRLSSAVVPDIGGGIEYPGFILYGKHQSDGATPAHEVSHQWFYGLVGDDQARDPWLDEGFATYVEALQRGSDYSRVGVPSDGIGQVGRPMTYWESRQTSYYVSVYLQGAVALLRARDSVGSAAWDHAIRCYVNANAHRIGTPADLARSLSEFPGAIRILQDAGALPR